MSGDRLPRLLVLDDREGPVRSAPGWTVEEVFIDSAAIAARQVDDYLARRLDPVELLDPEVVPGEGALDGLLRAPH